MLDGTVAGLTRKFRPIEPDLLRIGIITYLNSINISGDSVRTLSRIPRHKQDTRNILDHIEEVVEGFLERYNRNTAIMNQNSSLYTRDEIERYQTFSMEVLKAADRAHFKARQGHLFARYVNKYHRNKRVLKGFESENGLVMRSSLQYQMFFGK